VPEVIWDLTTKHVLTTDLVHGETLDKMESADQATRNSVCQMLLMNVIVYARIVELNCMKMLFVHENYSAVK